MVAMCGRVCSASGTKALYIRPPVDDPLQVILVLPHRGIVVQPDCWLVDRVLRWLFGLQAGIALHSVLYGSMSCAKRSQSIQHHLHADDNQNHAHQALARYQASVAHKLEQ